jgi:hypothetical protein
MNLKNDYLNNDYCKFELLDDNTDYTIKKDFFVTTLFKLRKGSYKNFDKYLSGLKYLNIFSEKNNLKIKLFIDNNIYHDKKIMDFLKSLKNVSIVLFKCEDYIIENNYHIGLFSTLIRFFPMFDFPNNDCRITIIVDADVNEEILKNQMILYETILKNLDKNIKFGYSGRFYHINQQMKLINDHLLPYITASNIINYDKIKKKILYKFLDKIKPYMNKNKLPEKIFTTYNISKESYNKKCENNVCFGIDEYFLNKYLLKYLIKHKHIFFYFVNISYPQFNYFKNPESTYWKQYMCNFSESYKKKYKMLLSELKLQNYSFEELDKLLFYDNKHKNNNFILNNTMLEYSNNINTIINKKEYKEIFELREKYISEFLTKHKKYYIDIIIFFNSDINNIILNSY